MSVLSKIKLDEETELEFSMQIMGTTQPSSDVRLFIEGKEYDVVCHGRIESDSVFFKVPKLKNVFESGEYTCRMEVLIDGKVFTPLKETIEFLPLVEFEVKKTKEKFVKEEVIVKQVKVKTKIDEAIEAGFAITKFKDFNILSKEGKYYGIVSENKMIMANKAHDTVIDLVESLI